MLSKEAVLGERGERAFLEFCNRWGFECLQINQEQEKLSTEMYNNYEKRPDFYVNIPDIGPLFVEVKVREQNKMRESGPLSKHFAFKEQHESFTRIQNFQKRMTVSTWYAFLDNRNGEIDESAVFLCPVSRMEKFIPSHSKGNFSKWPYITIPKKCMNQCDDMINLGNPCRDCREKICVSITKYHQ
jgi:hypothetical protein